METGDQPADAGADTSAVEGDRYVCLVHNYLIIVVYLVITTIYACLYESHVYILVYCG